MPVRAAAREANTIDGAGRLYDIVQDIGELQRAAEFRCNAFTRRCLLPKDSYREPCDGDRHALAITIELC
jgi:hypothetical protein